VNWRTFAADLTLTLGLAAVASGCAGTSKEVDTLKGVDDLVGRVELLHFEAELSKARSENALDSLEGVANGGFRGDPVAAFDQLIKAVELSEEQADALRDAVEPMHSSAEAVFAQWAADAGELRIDSLRTRSLARLEETRTRYSAILVSVEQAQKAYDAFNVGVRDHSTYLQNDFNAASVADIQEELHTLAKWAGELNVRLDACMQACERYVAASALPGTVEVANGTEG
jgi:ElaB/YqjD/DUF883 family membrane-anchored ribosome-binding protein